jgi:hypothetical protein
MQNLLIHEDISKWIGEVGVAVKGIHCYWPIAFMPNWSSALLSSQLLPPPHRHHHCHATATPPSLPPPHLQFKMKVVRDLVRDLDIGGLMSTKKVQNTKNSLEVVVFCVGHPQSTTPIRGPTSGIVFHYRFSVLYCGCSPHATPLIGNNYWTTPRCLTCVIVTAEKRFGLVRVLTVPRYKLYTSVSSSFRYTNDTEVFRRIFQYTYR